MTPASAKKHLEVIKAFAEGKKIQCLGDEDVWYDEAFPGFYKDREYRVKPKPIELELWYRLGAVMAVINNNDYSQYGWVKKKFREVIE